ncbi:D-alanyl-D-alanine carboxypeptidase/D-alanyl-D-alanine endopeptidase [Cognatishimia maritima]|uniref:D-alanyl-D-alanine carboxypeptidase / D-alanyl-D-alanine-endopeptidase (Penicillin-binding protein 4) n=1 Tax=Cognatishimia maritima TaxID=870908 RepID=A0A1M5L6B1_9RHOB|nr:D-alanyl-D-alanine carboxypeptidase/D-alanyl-D-alanine-endopeptidase [Cognatishimia maritima]SHG60475.1 D-alanyl-D-alanine carboxypeptidase / D-alanyl-D-alanine-endopeptidase (penicillin-binding protein 4) [Cognatishimia maritima]
MSRAPTRRALLGGLASLLATPLWANAPSTSLRPIPRPGSVAARAPGTPDALLEAANLGGAVSFAVAELGTGRILEASEPQLGLPPASVAKAVTALYALDLLGADHRFQTMVVVNGPIVDGVLTGDLALVGGGDPTLNTDGMASLVAKLAAHGIKRVDGRFVVYGGALPYVEAIDPGQPKHVGYATSVSGICLNFNRVYFDWKKVNGDFETAMEARSEKHRPKVRVARIALSDRKAPVFSYENSDGIDRWTVSRHALNKEGGRWLPTRQPEVYAGEVFRELAKTQGITMPPPVKTTSRPTGEVVAILESARLEEILRGMLRYSTNITAEMVGLAATKARGVYAASLRASGREMEAWASETLGITAAKFVDHSGLGDQSRIRADELAKALAILAQKSRVHPILKGFTMKDAKGRPVKNHPIAVRAKTGTLNFVSGLGGYMKTASGEELAFAIFAADTDLRDSLTRAQRERPQGARSWNSRAKKLQQALIERWGALYAS